MPNLDFIDNFARSRSRFSLKIGKTVWNAPMTESFYSKVASISHVHHSCFPVNITIFFRTLSQKISQQPLTFPKWEQKYWIYAFPWREWDILKTVVGMMTKHVRVTNTHCLECIRKEILLGKLGKFHTHFLIFANIFFEQLVLRFFASLQICLVIACNFCSIIILQIRIFYHCNLRLFSNQLKSKNIPTRKSLIFRGSILEQQNLQNLWTYIFSWLRLLGFCCLSSLLSNCNVSTFEHFGNLAILDIWCFRPFCHFLKIPQHRSTKNLIYRK